MFSISRASTSAAATASHAVQHAYHAVAAGAGAGAGAAAGLGATTKTAASSVPVHWRSFSSAGHRHIPVIRSLGQLRRWRAEARDRGLEVGLVPTMGALHDGHLRLVRQSMKKHPLTVMSLFVNPMQFAPHEDLDAYPRTLDRDLEALRGLLPTGPQTPITGLGISEYDRRVQPASPLTDNEASVVVFAPTTDVMYPLRGELQDLTKQKGVNISVRGWGDVMEGASRPQFFTGVATVCTKLFNAVQPDHAYFGQKDIQQALILKILQTDLLSSTPLPENLHILPTSRCPETGLALSSRNAYLSESERKVAPVLHRALVAAKEAWRSGASGASMIEAAENVVKAEGERIAAAGEDVSLKLDYFEVFDRDSFAPVRGQAAEDKLVVAGAVWVGKTRLIDNILLGWEADPVDE